MATIMLALSCVNVGVAGGIIGVKIDANQTVRELKSILERELQAEGCTRSKMHLYLAKKNGTQRWMTTNDDVIVCLQAGSVPGDVQAIVDGLQEEAPPDYTVQKWLDEQRMPPPPAFAHVHILIDCGRRCLATSSTRARRLRWDEINKLIRSIVSDPDLAMDRDAVVTWEGDETERRRLYPNYLADRVRAIVPSSQLAVPPSFDIADHHIQALQTRIRQLYKNYSYSSGAVKYFVAAVLETACVVLGDATILLNEEYKGKYLPIDILFEFVLVRGDKKIAVAMTTGEVFAPRVAQCMLGLEVLVEAEPREVAYGIVTSFSMWNFIVSGEHHVQELLCTLGCPDRIPLSSLRLMVGMICTMFEMPP